MYTTLKFRIKNTIGFDKHKILELFIKDWIDGTCDQEVQYNMFQDPQPPGLARIFRVDFFNQEDATALRLKGIPSEFRDYIEII